MIRPTHANLRSQRATKPLTQWLISAARRRTTLTYGEAKRRLEEKHGFGTIFSAATGKVAGAAMDRILKCEPSAPLLNLLLVGVSTRLPERGARGYLAGRFPEVGWLKEEGAHKNHEWKDIVEKATGEVYAYRRWDNLYKRVYGSDYKLEPVENGKEKDGLPRGRTGEGKNHKALRLRVKENPGLIERNLHDVRTETEVELLSGDRVDVVCYASERTVAVEVKSRDSNWTDLRRGIYQCVKYRAVLRAQDLRENPPVYSWLVTELQLPNDLIKLAKKLGVRCRIVAPH